MAIFGNQDEFRKTVDDIKREINNEFKSRNNDLESDAWLRTLYENYTKRFLSDNERIWTTASIMNFPILCSFCCIAINKASNKLANSDFGYCEHRNYLFMAFYRRKPSGISGEESCVDRCH